MFQKRSFLKLIKTFKNCSDTVAGFILDKIKLPKSGKSVLARDKI
jgi:hypothetical protein